jgi:hypothetical protein
LSKAQTNLVYANEADVLNMALFGQTAAQWRAAHPKDRNCYLSALVTRHPSLVTGR